MELFKEANFEEIQIITESEESGEKSWFIEGVYCQGNIINKNRRIYPLNVLDESMHQFENEFVLRNRAVGELNHPNDGNLQINPERISHKIISLSKNGNSYIGKAKILNTPCGKIVQSLLEGGVVIGVSSRAEGTTKLRNGIKEVQSPLAMKCIDVVFHPSCPDALMDSLYENELFVSTIQEADEQFMNNLKKELLEDQNYKKQEQLIKSFNKFIKKITEIS